MAQLTYDEIRLLRELKNDDQTISGNKPHGGLDRLVKEGYVRAHSLNLSEVLYSITVKGTAALHEADGND
jgi:DNA-binding PadR family transcriptional regulator